MTTVGILGVTHDENLRVKYGLTLDFIKEMILEFHPDVICGEVLPASWERYRADKTYKQYWGMPASEYWDLIFPLCEEYGIPFVPVDWAELDVWKDFDPFAPYPLERRNELEKQLTVWEERKRLVGSKSPIPFNSQEYDQIAASQYEWLQQINPTAHNLRWICRHQVMVQRIKNAIKKYNGKTLLCIAGADHNHCFYDSLKAEKELIIVYPLK